MIKRILSLIVWFVSAAALLVLLGFAREAYHNSTVGDIQVHIVRAEAKGFIAETEVLQLLNEISDSVVGQSVKQLKMEQLSGELKQNPWAQKSNLRAGLDGVLRVHLYERQAILRVYNQRNQSVYVDQTGAIFHTSRNFTPRVQIASGHIHFPALREHQTAHIHDSIYRETRMHELFILAKALQQDDFLHALIDQIYVNSLGEYELSPKLGRAYILLGELDRLHEKLNILQRYYRQSAYDPGMLDYRSINLKYRNQIVCTKI